MKITIRRFEAKDIPNKVVWINNPENNRYLHYNLPLEEGKTKAWFEKSRNSTIRYDAVIEADGIPCGLIGLLNIDSKNKKAEYYISMGESIYKGKGIATESSRLLLNYAFDVLGLNRVYLYTEADNIPAQKLFEKVGFIREGHIHADLFSRGKYVDRIMYGMCRTDYRNSLKDITSTAPVQKLGKMDSNSLYIKRDDLLPFSFGGNKARKAKLFFDVIDRGDFDCVVTYGSSSSNHCRVISNMCAARGLSCYIISPEEASEPTFNSQMMRLFGAKITVCPVDRVHDRIEATLQELRNNGKKPYFIPGGGHGNLGTQAYVNCYQEIVHYEAENNIHFDYIFHASGTGTTQAGLVCGQLMSQDERTIIGISIARKNPYGRNIILNSVREYFASCGIEVSDSEINDKVNFIDTYTDTGYGGRSVRIENTIKYNLLRYGIPMDSVYTGKAFAGMRNHLVDCEITGKNVLFIHTGGAPLFFNDLLEIKYECFDTQCRNSE